MADAALFPGPVAQNVNAGNGLQTLAQLLSLRGQQIGIAQQQVALSTQQQQLSSATSQATTAAIHTRNLQNLQSVNWKQFDTPNGYDLASATAKAQQVGGTDAPEFSTRLAGMVQTGTAAKQALFNFNQSEQEPIRAIYGTWANDPKALPTDLYAQLQAYQKTLPAPQQANIGKIIQNTNQEFLGPDLYTGQPRTLAQTKALALGFSRAGLPPSEVSGPAGLATPGPGTVNTGTQVLPTVTNRMTGVTQAAKAPPIANLSDQINLPNNQVAVLNRATGQYELAAGRGAGGGGASQASSQAARAGAAPKSAGPQRIGYLNGVQLNSTNDPQAPGPNDPTWRQQTYGNVVVAAQKSVLAAQEQDANYGTNMQTANMIRQYSNGTNTGPGTTGWTHFLGMLGSRFGSQNVADTQTLASFLDLQSSRLRESMGLPATNAGLATSQEMGTSIESQRAAIQAKTDYYQALTQLNHDYRLGLESAGNGGVNPSPTAVTRFKRAFAANADPIGVEIQLAMQRGDTAAAQKLLKGLSPQQRALVAKHGRALDLISQGQMPQ